MKKRLLSSFLALVLCAALITPAAANNTKLVALTFDDGPNRTYTPILLDGLKERGVHATFFLVGQCAERNCDLVSRIASEGNQVCNHSYSHPWFSKIGSTAIKNEVSTTDGILGNITGQSGFLLRVPYGDCFQIDKAAPGKPLIQWSVDPCSGVMSTAQDKMLNNIYNNAKDGSIILLHDSNQKNVTVGLTAVDKLLDWGYEFVTVSELYRLKNLPLENSVIYYSAKTGAQEQQYDETALKSHWAYSDIDYVSARGIMTGDGLGWRPNLWMTRAEAVVSLWRAAESPKVSRSTGFEDVPNDAWYAGALSWAVSKGYIKGESETVFDADGYVTKEMLYALAARVYGTKLSGAQKTAGAVYRDDVRIDDWAKGSVSAIREAGFVSKNDREIFRPLDNASRAELAELLTFMLRDLK